MTCVRCVGIEVTPIVKNYKLRNDARNMQNFHFVHCFRSFVDIYGSFHTHAMWNMIYLLAAIGLKPGGSSTVHKQYTEERNETQYPEQNIYNNKNT